MIYWHKYIFMNTKLSKPAVETPALRTSQDITTFFLIFYNDLLTSLSLFEHKVIN